MSLLLSIVTSGSSDEHYK